METQEMQWKVFYESCYQPSTCRIVDILYESDVPVAIIWQEFDGKSKLYIGLEFNYGRRFYDSQKRQVKRMLREELER